ncbi:MAG: adenylosuccinate lyase [Nitrososphaerota archaeon]|nr:adenylosuccinate lyase [Nitrososphaerota archaeon]
MSYDALSPIDGRYASEAAPLGRYFSERALMEKRILVELEYLRLLVDLGVAPHVRVPAVALSEARMKRLEAALGHDVKAVEVYIREDLKRGRAGALSPYVHLGLTSEDTNSVAFALLLKGSLQNVLSPAYSGLAERLALLARAEAKSAMLARTHGRPALPTTFGKEMAVFAVRLAERVSLLRSARPVAKVSGAVGTYASFAAMQELDWPRVFRKFAGGLGLGYAEYTTQVVPGENLSDILHLVINVNQLMHSLSRDLWLYQTLGYVRFARPGKVSSSTMPQKVNPVDVENAEGQCEVSNSMLSILAYRLQETRMQRDLSDSVMRRMVGQGLAHSLVACRRLVASLGSMTVERASMAEDLAKHPEVYAEAEQISMRLAGDEEGYQKVMSSVARGSFRPRLGPGSGSGSYLGIAPRLALDCPRVVSKLLRPRT